MAKQTITIRDLVVAVTRDYILKTHDGIFIHDFDVAEIAYFLGCSTSTVRKRLDALRQMSGRGPLCIGYGPGNRIGVKPTLNFLAFVVLAMRSQLYESGLPLRNSLDVAIGSAFDTYGWGMVIAKGVAG